MILEAKFTEAEQELNANFGTYAMVGGKTDLNYDPNSKNAQSGIAVEEAFESKKADTLFVDDEDKLEGKYPSALASKKYADAFGSSLTQKTQELEQMAISLSQTKADKSQIGEIETALDNKVDKEEGKTLYRGMEEIVDYTTPKILSSVNISLDKNEQPFELDEIYLFITSPTALPQTSTSLTANFNGGSGSKYKWFLTVVKQGTQTLQAYAKKLCHDRWLTVYHQTSSTIYNNTYMTGYSMGSVDYINSILIEGLDAYPAGTRIRICGRGVD